MTVSELSDAERIARGLAFHEQRFGRRPSVVAFAPGRVNLIGEHTDYNGGLALPIAIQRGVVCTVSPRSDEAIVMHSAQAPGEDVNVGLAELSPDALQGWPSYVAGSIAMAIEHGWHRGGVSITVDGDLPLGAGLSSSAALECSVLQAVVAASSSSPTRLEIALAAQAAEHAYPKVPCGILDQATSMLAREGEAVLLDSRALTVTSAPLSLDQMDVALLIIDTNARHELTDGGYANRRQACEQAAALLGVDFLAAIGPDRIDRLSGLDDVLRRRARHVITENARVLDAVAAFGSGDVDEVGRLFAASHRSLAEDFEVSCVELDAAVGTAVESGAVAARMTGGGFGGSVIALVPPARLDAIRTAVTRAFADRGFATPDFLDVVPSPGARVLSIIE